MSEATDNPPRRRYDGTGRRAKAQRTRAAVIEAAARVFQERGYAGATIPVIAAEAGVSVETVYRAAAGKAGLLAAAVQAALAGGAERAERPVEQRAAIRAVIDEPDPRRAIRRYAGTQPGLWARTGPLLLVLDAAAGDEPELVELRADLARQRRLGQGRLADRLADLGALRRDVPVQRARDIVWALCAQATFDALVTACGWSHVEYRDWLAEMLVAALLEPVE
jgi:AcrR family transcriptional regulator